MLCKKKGKKRGFTLVELIVVLVILAMLASLLVPALTGYIDRARESTAIAEARAVAVAGRASYADYYAHREGTPSGGTQLTKNYIGPFFEELMKSECGMTRVLTLRARLRDGNRFAIETGAVTQAAADKLVANVVGYELGGNCAEFFVKSKTFDSLVALNYVSKDKRYLVTVIFEPENTRDFKSVEPGAYIVTKIE